MEVLYLRCCGLDVHKETVVACLRVVSGGKVDTDDFDDGRDLFGRDPPPFPFRPTRYHLELETLVQPDCPVIVAQSIGKQGQRQLSRAASAIAPAKAGRGMVEQV